MVAERIWRIRFAAFALVYAALLASPLQRDALQALMHGLYRMGAAPAFVAAPVVAMIGVSRLVWGYTRWGFVLVGAGALALFFLGGSAAAFHVALIGSVAVMGAALGRFYAVIAVLALAGNLSQAAVIFGPLGDILAVLGGGTVFANVVLVAVAILLPLVARRLDWQ